MRDAAIDTHRSAARGAARSRPAGPPSLDDVADDGPLARPAPRRGGITSATVAAQRLGGGRFAARAAGARAPGFAARLRGRVPRVRPLKALTIAAFGVALVGIVANAMVFQRGRHPAPLFGLGHPADGAGEDAQRTAAAAAAPVPPAPVEKTGTIPPAPAPAAAPPEPAPAAAAKPAPAHHAALKPHGEGAKAKVAEGAPAHPRPGHAAAAHPKGEAKAEARAEAKPDAVAKLLAGPAHPDKADAKAAPASKPDAKTAPKAEAKAAPSPKAEAKADAKARPAGAPAPVHRRLAAAQDGKPAAKAE